MLAQEVIISEPLYESGKPIFIVEGGGLIIYCKTYAVASVGIDMHLYLCAKLSQLAGVEQGVLDTYAGIVEVME